MIVLSYQNLKNLVGRIMKKNRLLLDVDHFKSDNFFYNNGFFYDESYFQRMLIVEQKRMERSNTSFMLMLIDISELPECGNASQMMKKLLQAVFKSTRETDIKGWYAFGSTIGIIFTEYDRVSVDVIINKVTSSFFQILTFAQCSMVHFSYFIFPEDENNSESKIIAQNTLVFDSKKNTAEYNKMAANF